MSDQEVRIHQVHLEVILSLWESFDGNGNHGRIHCTPWHGNVRGILFPTLSLVTFLAPVNILFHENVSAAVSCVPDEEKERRGSPLMKKSAGGRENNRFSNHHLAIGESFSIGVHTLTVHNILSWMDQISYSKARLWPLTPSISRRENVQLDGDGKCFSNNHSFSCVQQTLTSIRMKDDDLRMRFSLFFSIILMRVIHSSFFLPGWPQDWPPSIPFVFWWKIKEIYISAWI